MKTKLSQKWSLAALALGLGLALSSVQAQHINAGAFNTNQGSQLYFGNGASYVNTSGYTRSLNYSNSGQFASWFNSSSPTFTAAAQTTNNGATPALYAAAYGSFLQLRIETVASGPLGGTFAFWEDGNSTTTPTFNLNVGQTVTTGNLLDLSDASIGAGTVGADPYGHLHGRRYAVSLPGDYLVGFRIIDTSINGLNGEPIHTDSDLFLLTFRAVAVPEPTALALVGLGIVAVGVGVHRKLQK